MTVNNVQNHTTSTLIDIQEDKITLFSVCELKEAINENYVEDIGLLEIGDIIKIEEISLAVFDKYEVYLVELRKHAIPVNNTFYILKDKQGFFRKAPINILKYSFNTKDSHELTLSTLFNVETVLRVYMPFSTSTFSDITLTAFCHNTCIKSVYPVNIITDVIPEHKPSLRVNGPMVCPLNENISMKVQLLGMDGEPITKPDVEVSVKTDKGYLPIQKQYTNSLGEVEFTFSPMLLSVGEVCTLKFGFDLCSNVKSHFVEVINAV